MSKQQKKIVTSTSLPPQGERPSERDVREEKKKLKNRDEKHILVAEDDAFLLGMIRRALSSHSVRVSTARDGQEAIDVINKDPPDLLLLDLLMPHVDGYAVLKFRKDKKLKFPVVVCSNLSDKKNIIRCQEFDVAEYVIKSDMDDDQIWTVAEKYLQ